MKIHIEIDRPAPRLPPPIIGSKLSYACPNCGDQLRQDFSCPSCPTWARGPGLRPYPLR